VRFHYAVAALLTGDASDVAVEAEFQLASVRATVATAAVRIVALLEAFDDTIAAFEAALPRLCVGAVVVSGFNGQTVASAPVTAHRIAVVANFVGFDNAIATGFAWCIRCVAAGVRCNPVAIRYTAHPVLLDALVADLVWFQDAVPAALAGLTGNVALVPGFELTIRRATVTWSRVAVIASFGALTHAIAALFAAHASDWAVETSFDRAAVRSTAVRALRVTVIAKLRCLDDAVATLTTVTAVRGASERVLDQFAIPATAVP
jgi:hypothetical protein